MTNPTIKRKGVCFDVRHVLSFYNQKQFVDAHMWMRFTRDDEIKRSTLKEIWKEAKRLYGNDYQPNT